MGFNLRSGYTMEAYPSNFCINSSRRSLIWIFLVEASWNAFDVMCGCHARPHTAEATKSTYPLLYLSFHKTKPDSVLLHMTCRDVKFIFEWSFGNIRYVTMHISTLTVYWDIYILSYKTCRSVVFVLSLLCAPPPSADVTLGTLALGHLAQMPFAWVMSCFEYKMGSTLSHE